MRKAYYEANKERLRAKAAARYAANKERLREYGKKYGRSYYLANKERIKARKKARYEADKKTRKAYYEANKERIKETKNKWMAKRPSYHRDMAAYRYWVKKGLIPAPAKKGGAHA